MTGRRVAIVASTVLALLASPTLGPARASSAPDAGVAFEPPALPEPTYAIRPPSADASQVRLVAAGDGVPLYTQTWLPAELDSGPPPDHLPVVVVYTPYATPGVPDAPAVIDLLVPRGYAVTFANVRGSGASGGCFGLSDQHEVDDGARVIEDAGTRAPWASGSVGMFGGSYPGGTQIATATGPDRERLQWLKALVVGAPSASIYEVFHHDGVPHFLAAPANVLVYLAALTSPTADLAHILDRVPCQPAQLVESADISGDYTTFWEQRDHSRHLDRLEAATLMVHGSADRRVSPMMQAGLFDAIPASTPRAGLFGVWAHEFPDQFAPGVAGPRRDWERADWPSMMFAWFERHLRDVDNGADAWPVAQVQGTDGQWRTATSWPAVPGPTRTLALGPGGTLGASGASGTTMYLEAPVPELEAGGLPDHIAGTAARFTTAPLAARLELIGTPTLDLWVRLALPDSHLTARLEAVDAGGQRVSLESRTTGARSAQHLEPVVGSRFRQRGGTPAPIGQPVLVSIRFDPIDLVVPAGARLRLTVAGSSIVYDGLDGIAEGLGAVFQGPTWPSGLVQPVTILHDSAHPSALTVTLPEADSTLLDVREHDQIGVPLGVDPGGTVAVDGGL
jgi:predicted acyl esterase